MENIKAVKIEDLPKEAKYHQNSLLHNLEWTYALKDEETEAVVFIQENSKTECFYAISFHSSKTAKKSGHYRFNKECQLFESAEDFFQEIRSYENYKKEQREKRKAEKPEIKKGDIVYTSWGYEQTNVDFYQVVDVSSSGKTAFFRQIGKNVEEFGFMSGDASPIRGAFVGGIQKARIQGNNLKIGSDYAEKWAGNKVYCSWYA